ncbi:isoleucine--tRNA ligase [Lewinella cohaerens]|uniref:isoleucine--tRNA ligase n=1 Tax=Lewinella cohaerens TaxID=70995 RepID=UPI00037E5F2B|nr:isoleucine--tRNA ligase [Lewinella cohaerens]
MYKSYKQLNLPEIDQEILQFWENEKIFDRSIQERDPEKTYVFYEGPPSANGLPGIHHVMARAIKDIFCRFHTLQGERVDRKGGWDTHGLPIELSVEKELGITKDDIGKKISVDEYNQKCRETVMRYKDIWDDLTRKMGYWVDLDNPYITYENSYIESVWFLLQRLHRKGLMYKGYTIQPFSPAAGTGLSSHELNMPGAYKEIRDTSAVAQFKVKDTDNEYIVAWTTTPWTLPSNTALAVGKKIPYVKVSTFNRYTQEPIFVTLAKDRLNAYFSEAKPDMTAADAVPGNKPYPYIEIVAEMTGAELAGTRYEQLMPYVKPEGDAFRVIVGDFVSTEDGTGIVHIAPTFGADDMRVAKENDIPALLVKDEFDNPMPLVDRQGKFVAEVTDFAGRYVKDYGQKEDRPTDVDIVIKLKEENKLFHSEKYLHSYPHCWRTDRPVLYYPLDSWFVRASDYKERMSELNKTINWKPTSTGEGRFGKWLENLQDWNLSRSRFWGIPLPIWRTEDGKQELCIGSIPELTREVEKANKALGLNQEVPKDLHRPYIDDVVLVSEDGQAMKRELDLIDVWFDSGSMPYAQWGLDYEKLAAGDEQPFNAPFGQSYPANFIAEGVDQTRGWFYTLHAIAVMAYDTVSFKNVVSNGLVLDKNGQKMSKRLGNAADPFKTLEQYGADATRWYMMANSDPWDNLKFDLEGIEEVRRKLFGTLFNTYSFFTLYANIDKWQPQAGQSIPVADRPEIDRWVISKLNSLSKEVQEQFSAYEPTRACRAVERFVDEHLSNWYVRLCRRRFWKGEMNADKQAAYETLYECLVTTAQLMSPVAPFFSDWLYRNLTEGVKDDAKKEGSRLQFDSVHLSLLEPANESLIDLGLEERMDYAQRISSLVLSIRKKDMIRVRQPLQKILLPVLDAGFERQVEEVKDLILAEVNVKEIAYLRDDEEGFLKKRIKPNFKTLGKRLGKNMKAAAQAINQFNQDDIAALEKSGTYTLVVGDENFELTMEDFEITTEDIPGWKVATDGSLTVALDLTLTDLLEDEGMARELVNRIQNIRKDKNFEVMDRITVVISEDPTIARAVTNFGDLIKGEVLADELSIGTPNGGEAIELPGELQATIEVNKRS